LTAFVVDVVWWVKTTQVQKQNDRSEVFQAVVVVTVITIALGPFGFVMMLATLPFWALYFVFNKVRSTLHSRLDRKAN
jgi:hypothetical protein